ncbi:MAG TPA: hypothetical protein PLD49_02525 [Thermoclostridium caenicola]|uniref:Membrane associated serine protease, rhomboid family n=1 Tax=Thermoclostridium caenicola TaxID=659425 RepID=A0A1M6HF88_9FIRM|nr:hypothetical protein [Thermoclostridium caenicola]SHJ20855.1 hypothetical protein SAMN05444373_10326 [Thermoclostridium caenicola]HOK42528.1 hypothetical protein [Thermoclostridium caenicola]HOL85426.1 hypothetical protein [Thermoclostridium caenicola]HPO76685.1 hypothetical protein [Thermoclostridium caenicola]
MKWLSRLELKYGRYAIRNLTQYLIGINIAVYVIVFVTLDPSFLFLIPNEVLRGQVWRLVSFIFLPETTNPIWVFLQLYLLYFIGTAIEGVWGRFKYNLFYFCGMIITIIAAFISGLGVTGLYLNLSLFLAFATLFPEQELLFFFVLPIKVKFLGLLEVAFALYQFVMAVRIGAWYIVAAIVASFVNYLLFFGGDIIKWLRMKKQVYMNRKRYYDQVRPYNRYRKY